MPSNLPEPKRIALAAFYAGRISAGELSQRLATGAGDAPRPDDRGQGEPDALTRAQARG